MLNIDKQIEKLMKLLGVSEDEAREIVEADKQIDKGEKLFELTDEQKANVKKASATGTRKATKTTRERKADTDKRELIDLIAKALENTESLEITNQEREINFQYNERKFKIVLSAPRT